MHSPALLRVIRIAILTVALAIGVAVAQWLAAFFEMDACLDAGGEFDRVTATCQVADGGSYVPVFERQGNFGPIFLVLGAGAACFVTGVLVLWVMESGLRRER